MRNTPKRMRPTSRPKHERRTKNTRRTPHSHYTNRMRGKRADTVILDEMPPNRFRMPPHDAEPSSRKALAIACAVVFGGLGLMYAITWMYGHFRWGW